MTELNKLIEQYERETGKTAKVNVYTDSGNCVCSIYSEHFVFWLASRPSCGVEQRKFLGEVETKSAYNEMYKMLYVPIDHDGTFGKLYQRDFDADLSKVVKGE